MSITKHKIFKIGISGDGKFNFEEVAEKEINKFLADSNNVYTSHSLAVISEDIDKDAYSHKYSKTINKYLVVSLVYKDLKETELDLSKSSKKVKTVVRKSIENGTPSIKPEIETDFDKKIKEVLNKKEEQEFEINNPVIL